MGLNRSSAPLLGVSALVFQGLVEVSERFAISFNGKLGCVKAVEAIHFFPVADFGVLDGAF